MVFFLVHSRFLVPFEDGIWRGEKKGSCPSRSFIRTFAQLALTFFLCSSTAKRSSSLLQLLPQPPKPFQLISLFLNSHLPRGIRFPRLPSWKKSPPPPPNSSPPPSLQLPTRFTAHFFICEPGPSQLKLSANIAFHRQNHVGSNLAMECLIPGRSHCWYYIRSNVKILFFPCCSSAFSNHIQIGWPILFIQDLMSENFGSLRILLSFLKFHLTLASALPLPNAEGRLKENVSKYSLYGWALEWVRFPARPNIWQI